MPYFIQRKGDQHCVMKGVKGQEGNETVKCHPDPASAQKHLAALMVNVEDAKSIDGAGGGIEAGVGIEEKAELTSESRSNLPDSAFLYIEKGGKKDESGKTAPRSLRHLPYRHADGSIDKSHLQNAISRLSQSATGTGKDKWLTPSLRESLLARARKLLKGSKDEKSVEPSEESSEAKSQSAVVLDARSDHDHDHSKFISYKSGDQWRWLAISSTAVEDREYETVSEKAYDDAIQYAGVHGYGDLDLVHVDGTEVGNCDQMFRVGQSLLEGGIWNDSPLAQKVREIVQENSDKWGVSIKFQYDPDQFDGSIYHGGIRILKRSILPRKMAASLGTAIVVQGGKAMKEIDETTKEALMELGMEKEKVEELAEQQKSLPQATEPNVKEKENETKADETLLAKLKKLILGTPETAQPDAEERSKETEVEVEQDESQEKEAKEVEVETPVRQESEYVLTEEAVKTISLRTAQVISPAIAKALNPIVEQVQSLTKWSEEWSESVQKRLVEVEKDIETKVNDKIAQLPPVVKVRTTELKAAEEPTQSVTPAESLSRNAEFIEAVSGIVTQAMGKALGSGEFKL